MINLLPQEGVDEVRRIYRRRLTLMGILMGLIVTLLSIILLLPPLFSIRARRESTAHALSGAKARPISHEADSVSDAIKETNSKLKLLTSLLSTSTSSFTDIVDLIMVHRTPDIVFRHIERSSQSKIILRGVARTRTSLLVFIKSLDGDPVFAEVISPISNLITNTDIDFMVDLSLVEEKNAKD